MVVNSCRSPRSTSVVVIGEEDEHDRVRIGARPRHDGEVGAARHVEVGLGIERLNVASGHVGDPRLAPARPDVDVEHLARRELDVTPLGGGLLLNGEGLGDDGDSPAFVDRPHGIGVLGLLAGAAGREKKKKRHW